MSRNGSGGYSLPSNSWNPAVNGVTATAADWQALINDVATAIQQSVSADGQTPITGNLQMGGNKLTGLGAGSGTGQSLRFEQLFSQGTLTDIASAATTDIGGQLTNFLRVTGTTGITSFGTNYNGPRFLIFAGAVLLTHSATLMLPGATNITTAANDALIAIPISGGWQVVAYTKAAGIPAIAGPLASSGITGAAASGVNSDITSLTGLTAISGAANALLINSATTSKPPVRQTVLSGPVDTNGLSAFGGSTGSTTVTASGTLIATAANGYALGGGLDYTGSIVNPSWTGLSTNGTMYLYLDIAANGTCTTGSTTLAPTYRWGGADVTTSGQFTFNIQEMVGKVGNGSTAVQTYRVFVGQVTVAAGVVSAITWYALQGRYDSGLVAALPAVSTQTVITHRLGYKIGAIPSLWAECVSTDASYSVGDRIYNLGTGNATYVVPINPAMDALAVSFTTQNTNSVLSTNKSTGAAVALTSASWRYGVSISRGW